MRLVPRRLHPAPRREQVPVRELHALRRARCAGGVDQSEQVVGPDGAPGRLEVEPGQGAPLELAQAVDHQHVVDGGLALERRLEPVEQRRLGHGDAGTGVPQQVLDLLRRAGRVDRERNRAEVDGGRIEEVELHPVREQESERVAAAQAEAGETLGQLANALSVLAPGEALGVARHAQRDLARPLRGRALERSAEGVLVECAAWGGLHA